MTMKKYALIVVVMVALIAFAGLGTDIAEAGNKFAPVHPPTCVKVLNSSFAGGSYELQCTDSGNDIISVQVKSNVKYMLDWNASSVTLLIPTDQPNDLAVYASWSVTDKNGSVVSGLLP